MHGLYIGKRFDLADVLAVSKCCKLSVSADCILCCLKVSCNIRGDVCQMAICASSITCIVFQCT